MSIQDREHALFFYRNNWKNGRISPEIAFLDHSGISDKSTSPRIVAKLTIVSPSAAGGDSEVITSVPLLCE
ncbi:hypothetical protein N8813_03825 [bacterium]|nr:hypothetical protein [bacterium]MDC0321761.1 hypothetical protein [Verrucomicrobiales bacterium]